MTQAQKRAVAAYRGRLGQRGIARLEVRVAKTDVSLVRNVVAALTDPGRADEARRTLREHFGGPGAGGLKELLLAAPSFEDFDLDRPLDRDVEV